MLPNGDPVQLTRDKTLKLSPVFFARRLAHRLRTVDPWDTWQVGVFGWRGSAMMKNASSLTWAEGGKNLLFSEIKSGLHMCLVTADEARDIAGCYVPAGERRHGAPLAFGAGRTVGACNPDEFLWKVSPVSRSTVLTEAGRSNW